jgi:hypothetical protein
MGGAFYALDNLRAACRACNYGAGPAIREAGIRQNVAELQQTIHQQRQEVEYLRERLAELEPAGPSKSVERPRPRPAIY